MKNIDKKLTAMEQRLTKKIEEAVDTLVNGMDNMHDDLAGRIDRNEKAIIKGNRRVHRLEDDLLETNVKVDDLATIIATRPTRKEFEELKKQVLKQ